jgi:hypothetical protein
MPTCTPQLARQASSGVRANVNSTQLHACVGAGQAGRHTTAEVLRIFQYAKQELGSH